MDSKRIPLSVPNLSEDILAMMGEMINTGWISTGGRFIEELEKNVSEFTGIPYAVALHSGTSGLFLSLKVLGVEAGDEVLVPTLTFVAAVNPVTYLHAHPVFMDCDDSLNMDLHKVEKFIKEQCVKTEKGLMNKKTGRTVKGILPVHVFGNPFDMKKLRQIADTYNLFVLEDATEALGSFRDGVHAGALGDLAVFSFNANKIITTAGGGMVLSSNKAYIDEIRHLANQAKQNNPYFIHDAVGYNFRMSNVHAAIGVSQMKRLQDFLRTKKENYLYYIEALQGVKGLRMLPFHEEGNANYWFYSLYVEDQFPMSRNELMEYLAEHHIDTRPVWALIHSLPPYGGEEAYEIEKAEEYVSHILNIPCSTSLQKEEIDTVVSVLKNIR